MTGIKYFKIENIKKHFTIINIIIGILTIVFITILKFSGLPLAILNLFNIDQTDLNEYMLAGFLNILSRLGIKSYLEEFYGKLFNIYQKSPVLLGTVITMDNAGGTNSGQGSSYQPGNTSQPGSSSQSGSNSQPGSSSQTGNTENQPRTRAPKFYVPGSSRFAKEADYIIGREFTICENGTYIIHDPLRQGDKGYIDPKTGKPFLTMQPYFTNFAAALKHDAEGDCRDFGGLRFRWNEHIVWHAYAEYQGKIQNKSTDVFWNSKTNRHSIRRHR